MGPEGFTVSSIARAVHRARDPLMAFIAYLDCSGDGTDASATVVSVGGYVAHESQWAEFERRWSEALKSARVDSLHMKEFAHSVGPFKDWKGEDEKRAARGESVAVFGPSPGFRELKWLKPVYVGDTIAYATEIVDLRPSRSHPQWGIMAIRNTGSNQRGEPVISFVSTSFVQCRRANAS